MGKDENMPLPEKAYVKNNRATIVCPSCHGSKTISVDNVRKKHQPLKVRCSCGYNFTLRMEFRACYRKETSLFGDYSLKKEPVGLEAGRTKVVNLSMKGACFEVRGHHNIVPGMRGELVFTLDNKKQTVLFREVLIKSVSGTKIGCEFLETNPPSRELGFYMLPGI